MSSTDIVSLIGSLGFPIVAYIMVFQYMQKLMDNNTKAINDLTLTVQKLTDKLDGVKEDE